MALKPPTAGTASAASLESIVTALQSDVSGVVADLAGALTDITTLEGAVATLQALPGVKLAGKVSIATSQARSNTAYGLLTTPDRVQNVVMPPNGLIHVAYQATWQESVQGAARAALFLGANQLRYQTADAGNASGPILQEALINHASAVNVDKVLATSPMGLLSLGNKASVSAYAGDVTTGQVIGGGSFFDSGGADSQSYYGFCTFFAAAGTYDVSVQFKASSGSVTAKNRKLWVWTAG